MVGLGNKLAISLGLGLVCASMVLAAPMSSSNSNYGKGLEPKQPNPPLPKDIPYPQKKERVGKPLPRPPTEQEKNAKKVEDTIFGKDGSGSGSQQKKW